MEPMSDAPEEAVPTGESEPAGGPVEPIADLAAAPVDPPGERAAADAPTSELPAVPAAPAEEPADSSDGFRWPRGLQATATRRALLLTALGGLIIAGLVTAIPAVGTGPGRLAGYIDSDPVPSTGARSNTAFSHAASGDCLMWPDGNPDAASIVKCTEDHRFEVAESLDMRTFPGAEYGPNAAPPTPARIQQITQEQCEAAVRQYMGAQVRPQQQVQRQPAVVRRPGVASVGRPADPVRAAATQPEQSSRPPSKARSPTSTSPRSGRPAPVWASTRLPTSRPTFPSTARHRTRWRSPARSTWPRSSPPPYPRNPSKTGSSRTPAPR